MIPFKLSYRPFFFSLKNGTDVSKRIPLKGKVFEVDTSTFSRKRDRLGSVSNLYEEVVRGVIEGT